VIVGTRGRIIAEHHPAVDRVLPFDTTPPGLIRFAWGVWRRRFDVWIDPKHHWSRNSARLAMLRPARVTVGYASPDRNPFDLALPWPPEGEHLASLSVQPLKLLHLNVPDSPRLSIGIPAESRVRAAELLGDRSRWTVLVNNSSGRGPGREWPVEHWRELLSRLAALRPTVFFLNVPPDRVAEAQALIEGVRQSGVEIRALPPGSLLDVAGVVELADLVVTVDTSIVHLAAALDRPIVAMYSADADAMARFRPLSTVQEVVQGEVGPVATIPVDRVEAACRRILVRLDRDRLAAQGLG
jgi:ADP-heptose:LPS heptosyltransferase